MRNTVIFASAILMFITSGCATTGQVDEISKNVNGEVIPKLKEIDYKIGVLSTLIRREKVFRPARKELDKLKELTNTLSSLRVFLSTFMLFTQTVTAKTEEDRAMLSDLQIQVRGLVDLINNRDKELGKISTGLRKYLEGRESIHKDKISKLKKEADKLDLSTEEGIKKKEKIQNEIEDHEKGIKEAREIQGNRVIIINIYNNVKKNIGAIINAITVKN